MQIRLDLTHEQLSSLNVCVLKFFEALHTMQHMCASQEEVMNALS